MLYCFLIEALGEIRAVRGRMALYIGVVGSPLLSTELIQRAP